VESGELQWCWLKLKRLLQICIVDVDYLCISVEKSSIAVCVLSFVEKSALTLNLTIRAMDVLNEHP
jgi:hypothetical protein